MININMGQENGAKKINQNEVRGVKCYNLYSAAELQIID
jgi:hypothetical protein